MPVMPEKMNKSTMTSPYYAGFNGANPRGATPTAQYGAYPMAAPRPAQTRPPQYGPVNRQPQRQPTRPHGLPADAVPLTPKELKRLKRARKRNKSYFFVMRKGVSVIMFICFFLYVLVFAASFINISPINGFVSLFTVPDNTPQTVRWEYESEVDEDGYPLIYEDKSEYIGVGGPVLSFFDVIMEMLGLGGAEEPAEAQGEAVGEEGEEVAAPEAEGPARDYYKEYLALMEDRRSDFDITTKIAYNVFKFFPAAILLAAITALIALFTSFGATRGRRIYRGFGAAAIIMLIAGIATIFAGFTLSNVLNGNPLGMLDFSNIQDFLMRGINGPPYSVEEALAMPPVNFSAGYLSFAMVVLPLIVLIVSPFSKKRVSYKIFDR
jgi:hypothetical protein